MINTPEFSENDLKKKKKKKKLEIPWIILVEVLFIIANMTTSFVLRSFYWP